MTRKQEYKLDHTIGKIVILAISTALIISCVFIKQTHYLLLVLAINNVLYWFGVNTIAYIVETVMHHSHKHELF